MITLVTAISRPSSATPTLYQQTSVSTGGGLRACGTALESVWHPLWLSLGTIRPMFMSVRSIYLKQSGKWPRAGTFTAVVLLQIERDMSVGECGNAVL
ncbi:hypothetical protein RRG08_013844 [Elysia crispata]|uniref:Uncharacterized protein n=1 Tax=Elysia crispata TaxID=231223 RepID=A0AAE1D638_9GAST|nr:hypothetical protein RRG08_013844 [Elysia crispata]